MFPFADGARADKFLCRGEAGRYAQTCARVAGSADVGKKAGIAVGCFYEQLRLPLGYGARFQLLEAFVACGRVNGQLAVEGEPLSVET